jgi:hypothetical protein
LIYCFANTAVQFYFCRSRESVGSLPKVAVSFSSSFACLGVRFNKPHSKGEAVAAQSEEAGVAIAGSLDAGEKLMGRMGAAVMMAFRIVLMLRHRHPRSRSFANV